MNLSHLLCPHRREIWSRAAAADPNELGQMGLLCPACWRWRPVQILDGQPRPRRIGRVLAMDAARKVAICARVRARFGGAK